MEKKNNNNPNLRIKSDGIQIRVNGKWITPTIDDYEGLEVIGSPGANGIVLKGRHKITRREDAIKIWIPRKESEDGTVREEQYYAEIQKIAQLQHKSIVTIHNAWIKECCYYCSMEYINGITLKEWLKGCRTRKERFNILKKIFEAIYVYQEKGILHGDIHSKNIMVDADEEVHILDFGTSVTSRYASQSIDRETFLMYELVESVLSEYFSKESFLVRKYRITGRKDKLDDVRHVNPLLFSKSVLEFIDLELFKDQISYISDPNDLFVLCEHIAKGVYINVDYYYRHLEQWCEPILLKRFESMFYGVLEEIIYSDAQRDSDKAELVKYLSLYVYFNDYKENREKLHEEDFQKLYENRLTRVMSRAQFKKYMEFIDSNEDLFFLHDNLLSNTQDTYRTYQIEEDIRQILFEILVQYYKGAFLHAFRKQYLEMEIIKLNTPLYEKIKELSEVLNGDIIN